MEQYIDLDVSLKETHLCVVDAQGGVLAPGARGDASRAAGEGDRPLGAGGACRRTGDGRTVELAATRAVVLGVPAAIVDARRAKAALPCRLNKTDVTDAEGRAQLARTGWYRTVEARRPKRRLARSLLLARRQLAKQRRFWPCPRNTLPIRDRREEHALFELPGAWSDMPRVERRRRPIWRAASRRRAPRPRCRTSGRPSPRRP